MIPPVFEREAQSDTVLRLELAASRQWYFTSPLPRLQTGSNDLVNLGAGKSTFAVRP